MSDGDADEELQQAILLSLSAAQGDDVEARDCSAATASAAAVAAAASATPRRSGEGGMPESERHELSLDLSESVLCELQRETEELLVVEGGGAGARGGGGGGGGGAGGGHGAVVVISDDDDDTEEDDEAVQVVSASAAAKRSTDRRSPRDPIMAERMGGSGGGAADGSAKPVGGAITTGRSGGGTANIAVDVGTDVYDEDEAMREAIKQSMALEHAQTTTSVPPPSATVVSNKPSTNPKSWFTGDSMYPNYIPVLKAQGNVDAVSWKDIIKADRKPPQAALLTAYDVDVKWVTTELPYTELIIIRHYNPTVDPAGVFKIKPTLTIIHPPLATGQKFHAKVMLLLFSDRLRVVISSANLSEPDWFQVGQAVWIQDFPHCGATPSSPFTDSLKQFFDAFHVDIDLFLYGFDTRVAKAQFVASVPGYYPAPKCPFGLGRLATITSSFPANKLDSDLHIVTSSLGLLHLQWVTQFNNAANPSRITKGRRSESNVHVLYPTEGYVTSSTKKGFNGAALIFLPRKLWSADSFCRGILRQVQWANPHREPLLSHVKAILWTSPEHPDVAHTIYIGSHNFSMSAWGSFKQRDTVLEIKNYECGVIFPCEGQGDIHNTTFRIPAIPYSDTDEPWMGAEFM
ncbi:protein-tyrosine phosphatase 3 [Pelomyxa schiedti]|nr:protein-tyrosine phosphatase 3 [Pelomyxa schiedti]